MSNQSEATGREQTIDLFTSQLRDGTLLYIIGVARRDAFATYGPTFQRIVFSIRLTRAN